jgi:tetratricopeptide (TPR) repeat protein
MIDQLTKTCLKLVAAGKIKEALDVSRKILELQQFDAFRFYNHYILAKDLGLIDEAIDALNKAKDLNPACPIIRILLSSMLLEKGKFKEGLAEKEYRFNWPLKNSPCPTTPLILEFLPKLRKAYKQPYWNGKEIKGKTLLVFNEAGHGDLIQNIRYMEQLKALSKAKIIVEVKPELATLFECIKGVDEWVICHHEDRLQKFVSGKNDHLPPHDYVVSCESLHHLLNPELLDTERFSYIHPKQKQCQAVDIIKEYNDKLKIGIAWAGNKADPTDRFRSCPVKHFKTLQSEGVQLFSLQKGDLKRVWQSVDGLPEVAVDLSEGLDGLNIIDVGEHLQDFNDTALAMQMLDMVVAVDTSIVHLAGAVGIPARVMLANKHRDWRWQKKWYMSVSACQGSSWEEMFDDLGREILKISILRQSFCDLGFTSKPEVVG